MTTQQDDWMTELLASHPNIGRLCWFTVGDEPVDQHAWLQAIIQAGLAPYGWPHDIPATTAYLRGLHAMQRATPTKTLLRCVERERGRSVHHWIQETVSGGQVQFTVLAAIERQSRNDTLSIYRQTSLSSADDAALSQLSELIDTARHTYTPGDRRRQVRQWLGSVGALHMEAAGPVQFVPDSAGGLLDALTQAQADLGLNIWSMPLQRSQDVIATLTQSLDADITQKTTALLKRVHEARQAGKTLSAHQQTQLLEQFQSLDSRVQHYASLFGGQLTNLTTQIEVAKQALRQALAT